MTEYATELDDFNRNFLHLEEELELFELTINNIHIWERVRTGVGIELLNTTGLTGEVIGGSTSFKDQLRGGYLMLRNVFARNPFLANSSEILFMGHPRRKRLDDSWWDIYCDPIHEKTQYDSLHLESPWRFRHLQPAKTENLRYVDLIWMSGLVARKLGLSRYELEDSERRRIDRIESAFTSTFGVDIEMRERFRERIETRRIRKRLYDALIRRLDPRLAVIVAYSRDQAFIESCHTFDVPVVELQHGQISPYSYQYSFPGNRIKRVFPDYLLTFGKFWQNAANFPIDDDRIIPVGYPYLEQEVNAHSKRTQTDQVIFISTPETGPKLSKVAVDLSKRSEINRDIVYKLHPGEYDGWKTDYPWLRNASVQVVAEDGPSLYKLFAESSVQVGVGSTALYEGLAFGVATYLFKLPTVEWAAPIIENGEATVVESINELIGYLSDPVEQTVSPERYFEPNAIVNISSAFDELLRTGSVAQR